MDSNNNLQRLITIIRDINLTMFTTVNKDGSLVSRPMLCHIIDEEMLKGQLWFFTKKDTSKVHSIENDSHVNLAYANPDKNQYVSISGKASLVEDRKKMEQLWNPALKEWFPEGLDNKDIGLVAVDIQNAEVWDNPQLNPSFHSQHLDMHPTQ
jgi:general stress protein 26